MTSDNSIWKLKKVVCVHINEITYNFVMKFQIKFNSPIFWPVVIKYFLSFIIGQISNSLKFVGKVSLYASYADY